MPRRKPPLAREPFTSPDQHPQLDPPDQTEGLAAELEFPYVFRIQLTSTGYFVCPACGHCTRIQLHRRTFVVRCTENRCQRVYGLGYVLHVLGRGTKLQRVPLDLLIYAYQRRRGTVVASDGSHRLEAMPEGEIAKWNPRQQYINRVRTEEAAGCTCVSCPVHGAAVVET